MGVSFQDLKKTLSSSNENGLFFTKKQLLGNLFAKTDTNTITSMDVAMIKDYNKAIDEGVESGIAFKNTMFGASTGAKQLANSANGGKISLEGVKVAADGATGSMIGARIATVALQTAITFGIAIAIQGLITLFQKLKESIPTVENTTKWLEESSQEVKDIQDDINGLNDELKTTKDRIDELIKKPSLTIVEQNELDRLQKTNAELERKIQLQERALQITQGKNSKNFIEATKATRNTQDDSDLWDNESSAIAIMARQYADVGSKSYNAEDFFSKILEAYQNAETKKVNATEEELKNIEDFQTRASNWMSAYATRLQANLDELGDYDYNTLSDEAKAQVDYINDVLNTYNKLLGNDETVFSNIYNQERFAEAKQSIENLKEAGQLTAETLMSLYSKDENVKAMVDNMVKVGLITDTTANSFNLLTNQIVGTKEASKQLSDTSLFTIDTEELQSQIDGLKDSIDDIASAYSDMMSIIDDYNENGNLSVDNLEKLIELGDDYIGTLFNENGELELNKDSYIALAKAKLEDIRYSMLEKAISEINSLKKEDETVANQSLAESTGNLTEATLQLVAAQKLAEGYDSTKINAIMQTYYQWNALIDNVVAGLENNTNATLGVSDATDEATDSTNDYKDALETEKDALEDAKDALQDQKNALEDIKDGYEDAIDSIKELIDWVQDYIKQVKNNEIDALEEKKEKIDDLIESQKDLLNAEKDEYEWNKTIAEKQNTVAKDALAASIASLDDSSAGKKAQKQANEKLADSRADIIDELYEHSIDERLDYLDELKEQQDDYYDDLIDKINDYLSDEVQLYKDACDMIDNDSGDLYSKLLWYCQKYTTTSEAEFNHMWNSAKAAMQEYNTANLGTFDLLNNLQSRIYEVDSAIDTVAQSISEYESAIDGVQRKINDLGDSAKDTIDKINSIKTASVTGNWYVDYNGKKYSSFFDNKNDAINDLKKQVTQSVPFNELNPLLINDSTVKHYASGTRSAKSGIAQINENGLETLMRKTPDGDFVIMNQDDKVYTKKQTDNLYDFASDPEKFLSEKGLSPLSQEELANLGLWGDSSQLGMINSAFGVGGLSGLIEKITGGSGITSSSATTNNIAPVVNITIQGDATQSTVNALHAEAENIIQRARSAAHNDFIETVLKGRKWR